MPKVSQAYLTARREQILIAAVACFSREGFHQTTMQDIVKESGLSPGSLYLYFKSKEELVEAIAQRRHKREWALIREAARERDTNAAFRKLMAGFFDTLRNHQEQQDRRLALQLWAEALRNPAVLRSVRRGVNEPRRLLGAIIRKAKQRGELLGDADADGMARVMIALFQGCVLQLAWDPKMKLEPFVRTVERLFEGLSVD
ncbi:MAG TPA: TetR/AcrR family transcriptional regulator [Bryobacteraceae bacterium]|nr:TetR/AcrR family transcriptional regulator [Bryobacteraceae bacterium]